MGCVLVALFFASCRAAGATPANVAPASNGAGASPPGHALTVLDSCWSAEQLAGTPNDKKIRRIAPDLRPPERLEPAYKLPALPPAWRGSVRRVTPANGDKPIALTFDLCETAGQVTGYDAAIVNYLRAQSVPATFFAGGKWLRSHPEKAMQLMADPLFEIGNHAWTHGNLRRLTGAKRTAQIDWTQAEYELLRDELRARPCAQRAGAAELDKIPPLPRAFRFPYGACAPAALDLLAADGLAAVQWDVAPGDPVPTVTPRAVADYVLAHARPGSIVVLHANGRSRGAAEALPLFVPRLRELGYRFVTISTLLNSGTPVAVKQCYQDKPGDTDKY